MWVIPDEQTRALQSAARDDFIARLMAHLRQHCAEFLPDGDGDVRQIVIRAVEDAMQAGFLLEEETTAYTELYALHSELRRRPLAAPLRQVLEKPAAPPRWKLRALEHTLTFGPQPPARPEPGAPRAPRGTECFTR